MDRNEKYFADDRMIIPEYIKRMSKEELDAEIERLEREHRDKKQKEKEAMIV